MVPVILGLLSLALTAVPLINASGATGNILLQQATKAIVWLGYPLVPQILALLAFLGTLPLFVYVLGIRAPEWNVMGRFLIQIIRWLLHMATSATAMVVHKLSNREYSPTPAPRPRPIKPKPIFEEPAPPSAKPVIPQEDKISFDFAPSENYQLPPLALLQPPATSRRSLKIDTAALEERSETLMSVLEDFGVKGKITKVSPGPVVTLYELVPAAGIKSSRVIGLANDIARSMCAISARVSVISGRNALGIELPNEKRKTVNLRELFASAEYKKTDTALSLALGHDISGAPIMADLARMPHLLVAGTTGSGKSVAINSMILSLLYRLPPDRCKMIMVDPKMLELSVYDNIPHLLTPVVTDPKKAVVALKWAVREMENRYRSMSTLGVRNIIGYNMRLAQAKANGETLNREVQTGFDQDTGKPIYETQSLDLEPLP